MDGPIGDNSLQAREGLYFIVWQLCGDIHNLFFFLASYDPLGPAGTYGDSGDLSPLTYFWLIY